MMRAPMPISLSTKNMRDSNIFSWIRTVPSLWVATTSVMDVRSARKPRPGRVVDLGDRAAQIGSRRELLPPARTMDARSVRAEADAEPAEGQPRAQVLGAERPRSSSSPPVTAASPMKEPISM